MVSGKKEKYRTVFHVDYFQADDLLCFFPVMYVHGIYLFSIAKTKVHFNYTGGKKGLFLFSPLMFQTHLNSFTFYPILRSLV